MAETLKEQYQNDLKSKIIDAINDLVAIIDNYNDSSGKNTIKTALVNFFGNKIADLYKDDLIKASVSLTWLKVWLDDVAEFF